MADTPGVWRTVRGRRVFIADGQSLSDAMRASGKFETAKGEGLECTSPSAEDFKKAFDEAKATQPPEAAWRVDDTHTVEEYEHDKRFVTKDGSAIAIEQDGNIISVCKNLKGNDRGSALLKHAVDNGGDRLDAFGETLYNFYTKNGFEPVSWTKFNEEYAPHDWKKGRDEPEPVIFYKYTGAAPKQSYKDFLKGTKDSGDYDEAKSKRDGGMKK